MTRFRALQSIFSAVLLTCAACGSAAFAQSPASSYPMLEQLNRETQALYQHTQSGLFRIQLPPTRWAGNMSPLNKWDRLNPDMRRQLLEIPEPGQEQGTDPTTRPGQHYTASGTIIIVRPPEHLAASDSEHNDPSGARPPIEPNRQRPFPFMPNNIGLLIDGQGHLLIPLFIEREVMENQPLRVCGPDGHVSNAKFLGSDRQTNLTLVQVDAQAGGKPLQLGEARPDEGSLVMYLSPGGSGRVGLWTGGAGDLGIVVTTDGRFAGVSRFGQFLSGSACLTIADQIARFGAVKRATLGVAISEVWREDPLRRQLPALGNRTAMRIDEVIAGSAADKAGLRPGDLVLTLAGEAVVDIPSFAAAIAARNGATELQVLRGDQLQTITVDLQQR